MKSFYFILLSICITTCLHAQNIGLTQLEAAFLQQNSLLLASKYNIDQADADIVQSKLWNNPTLSISEFNLWKTSHVEEQGFLFGSYGKSQQFAVDLEQLIETAGKRRKRVAVKELEKNQALFEYEELLRQLKKELRQHYYALAYLDAQCAHLNSAIDLFTQMLDQHGRQADLKNIAKADFFRVQTELMALQKERIELQAQQVDELSKLKLLTQNSELTIGALDFSLFHEFNKHIPLTIKSLAKAQNIGLKQQENEVNLARQQWVLEKAHKVPDLRFQVNYDRGGNIMRDFVGVGISVDLPVFNTNKGNIKASELVIQKQQSTQNARQFELETTVDRLQNQFNQIEHSLQAWRNLNPAAFTSMLENYQKHLQNKQITLLEFIDFTQAYRKSQQALLDMQVAYHQTFEELTYIVGQDF